MLTLQTSKPCAEHAMSADKMPQDTVLQCLPAHVVAATGRLTSFLPAVQYTCHVRP